MIIQKYFENSRKQIWKTENIYFSKRRMYIEEKCPIYIPASHFTKMCFIPAINNIITCIKVTNKY